MRVVHRVYVERADVDVSEIRSIGVEIADSGLPIIMFKVREDEVIWPAVQRWLTTTSARQWIHAEFSDEEVTSAAWCALSAGYNRTNAGGTEMGRGDLASNERLQVTFDLSDFCPACGIGLSQVAPFRIAGAPLWNGDDVLELDWFAGEVFVRPEVFVSCFEPFGVGSRPVEDSTGRGVEGIVQLVVEDVVEVLADERTARRCPACDRVRHAPYNGGRFPPLAANPSVACVRPAQWFGAGSVAHRRILISRQVTAALTAHRVNGVGLHPVAEGPATEA